MVDQVSGNFVDNYLQALKQEGVTKDSLNNNKLQSVFFDLFNENNDKTLDANEIKKLTDAPDLKENQDTLEHITKFNIPKDDIESVLLFSNEADYLAVTTKEKEGKRDVHVFEITDSGLRQSEKRELQNNEETKTIYNKDGSKTVEKGSVKTTYDDKNRITSIETQKNKDVKVKVDYEYEGDSTTPSKEVTTNPDGTKAEKKEDIKNPNQTEGPEAKAEDKTKAEEIPKADDKPKAEDKP